MATGRDAARNARLSEMNEELAMRSGATLLAVDVRNASDD